MHKICTNYQEPLCTPLGLDCFKGVRTEKAKCLKPCRGLYADMEKDNKLESLGTIPNFASAYSSYESYKRGFQEDVSYRTVPSYKPLKPTLHWIRIYFSSPTFDRVTRDETRLGLQCRTPLRSYSLTLIPYPLTLPLVPYPLVLLLPRKFR